MPTSKVTLAVGVRVLLLMLLPSLSAIGIEVSLSAVKVAEINVVSDLNALSNHTMSEQKDRRDSMVSASFPMF